jgi:hypothetical protein
MSTRKKIKLEAQRAVYDLENMMQRLKRIDELADGQSKVITQWLPPLVSALDTLQPLFERFHEDL